MPHILMVCTANICRSPVAEVLLRDRLQKRGLHDWRVSSAGTWAQVRRGASRYSIQVAAEMGLEINAHQSEMIDAHHMEEADLILCMEAGHAEALRAEFPSQAHKVHLLSKMVGRRYNIKDPYGGPLDGYERMCEEIRSLVDQGLDRIIELAAQ